MILIFMRLFVTLNIKTSIKNNQIKLKDEVGMAVPKNTQTRFCRDNVSHPLYIPTLAFSIISNFHPLLIQYVKCCYLILILIHGFHSYMCPIVCMATLKASIGMYSGCDTLSLQILFMNFLALPSLLHLSILCPQGSS